MEEVAENKIGKQSSNSTLGLVYLSIGKYDNLFLPAML